MADPQKPAVSAPIGSDESGAFPYQNALFNNLVARSLTVVPSSPYTPTAPAGAVYTSLNPVYVIAKGAKFDGVTDDTTAWRSSITAAQATAPDGATTGGVIIATPGVTIITAQLAETVGGVVVQGSGSYGSIIKRANSINQHMFHLTSAVGARFIDMGFDLNGATNATNGSGIWMDAPSNNVTIDRCAFINCDGFAVFVFGGPTGRNVNLRLINSDFTAIGGATHDLVTVISAFGVTQGCRFQANGGQIGLNVYESNDYNVVGCTFNSLGAAGGNILCAVSSCLGCTVTGNTFVGQTADAAIHVNCEQDNANNRNSVDVVITGNTFRGVATGSSIGIKLSGGSHANASVLTTKILGNIVDTWQFAVFYNNGTITGVEVADNDFTNSLNNFGNNVVPTGIQYHHNRGYNPVGNIALGAAPLAPAVPSSGTGVGNPTGVDCWVIISTGGGVTVSIVSIGGTTLTGITMAASSVLQTRVAALQTIALTYAGGTPTWQWIGD